MSITKCNLQLKFNLHIVNHQGLSNHPNEPPHRKSSLPKHTDVKVKFLEMCKQTLSEDVKTALRLPSFDAYEWEDWEILRLMETMFIELNLIEAFHISPDTLREWLYEVYKYYNDVPFHNFRHCFCVAQMVSFFSLYFFLFIHRNFHTEFCASTDCLH